MEHVHGDHRRDHPVQLRYLSCAHSELRSRGVVIDETLIPQLSPLGWDHVNLTGDYVWSDALTLDADGLMPLESTLA